MHALCLRSLVLFGVGEHLSALVVEAWLALYLRSAGDEKDDLPTPFV